MKIKRHKHIRKVLTFYSSNFGFKPPYNVLIDGTFCKAALKFKVNISEQLPKYLEADTKMWTTQCVLDECEAFGSVLYGPLKVLKQFKLQPCNHKSTLSASKCITRLIGKKNKEKLFLATQDKMLNDWFRTKAGTPMLYIAFNTITLEPPSEKSKMKAERQTDAKIAPSEREHDVIKKLKVEAFGEQEVKKKKHKKLKGANPLSMKPKRKRKEGELSKSQKKKLKRKQREHLSIENG
ncbi:rRNA-processing protein UTP23 homolog [Mytilus edulis]|uniref:rRNA-processing protein UTP23 homolog n=2 Tax=Mytilus TaxID=6548 RepID=A0A8B6GGU0_MYTGA|nr:U3 small nucleolar RNA-associated protein 23 [Mytilus galloprovincialis]